MVVESAGPAGKPDANGASPLRHVPSRRAFARKEPMPGERRSLRDSLKRRVPAPTKGGRKDALTVRVGRQVPTTWTAMLGG